MDNKNERRHFFKGAFLLAYAGLISKVLSAGYRIPLQNITGDTGFYIYQQIYPFIGMATILGLYGFPAAISRFVADQPTFLSAKTKRRILNHLVVFSIILFIIIFWFAPYVAKFMGDQDLMSSIRASAFPFLLLPFISYLRGIFQGKSNMEPTAISQITEQIVRVSLIIVVAVFVTKHSRSLYDIGVGTALAATCGILAALIILLLYNKRHQNPGVVDHQTNEKGQAIILSIIGYGLAIAINHMLLLLLQFVDVFVLVPLLRQTGNSLADAQVLKGVLDRGQPLAQLGIVTASSLALALIPSVTKARLSKDSDRFLSYVSSTWKFTLYIASGATVGLIVLFPEINTLLFKEDLGTVSLRIFTITIVFSALSISTASILQGMGHVFRTALFVLIGVMVKWLLNVSLVPYYNISGAALATVIASAVILALNIIQLRKILPVKNRIYVRWQRLGISLTLMAGTVFTANALLKSYFYQFSRTSQLLYLIVLIGTGVAIYYISLIKLSVFTKEEREILPFMKRKT